MSAKHLASTRKINARHIEVVVSTLCIQGAYQEPLQHPGCWFVMVVLGCWWLWYPGDFWVVSAGTWVRFCFPVSVLRTFQRWYVFFRKDQVAAPLTKLYRFLVASLPKRRSWKTIRPIYDSLTQVPWGTIFERMPLPRPSHLKTGDLTINQFPQPLHSISISPTHHSMWTNEV